MPLSRIQKGDIVTKTVDHLKKSEGAIFTDFTGVSAEAVRILRRKLKDAGVQYQTTKRTLARIAFKKVGVDVSEHLPKSTLGVAMLKSDLPAAAKILHEFAKKEKNFKILNAFDFITKQWLASEDVVTLAKLPSRNDLLIQLAYVLQAPMRKLAVAVSEITKTRK